VAGKTAALKPNPLGWPEPPATLRYGAAVLSVVAAVSAVSLMESYLPVAPHVSSFLIAIMFSAWFGGFRPGLVAVALSFLAFDYFSAPPVHSLAVEGGQLPRFVIFVAAAFFGWALGGAARRATESLKEAHDELRRSNEALRERGELMRVLTDNANDFIRLHTIEGRSIYASPSVERLYGRQPTTIFESAHPEDLEACQRWWEQAVAGEAGRLQWRVRDAGGNWRWLESSASLLQFKGRPHVLTVCRDITESMRAREALQESEAKLKEAQRLAKIGYWERDLLTDRITWSEEINRILGLEPPRVLSQAELQEMIHPDDRQLQGRALDEALRGSRRYDVEYRIVRPDGETRFIHVWDEIAYDESGRPIRMFGTVQDITERKRAEEALRQAERKLRLVVDTIPANVWRARPDGGVDFTNQRLLKDLGFSHQELADWNWTSILHPEDVTGFVNKWRAALASGKAMESEARVRRADGEYCWYLIRNVPLSNDAGKIIRWYGTGVDITERKRAEEALQESNAKLELILNTSPLPITGADADGRITSWNKAAERLFGWTAEEAVGRVCPTIPPEQAEEYVGMIRRVMRGETHVGLVHYRQKKGGSLLTCSVSAAPQRNARGEPVGVTIIVEDITERKQAEEALRESQQLLRLVLATLPVGVTVTDQAGDIVLANAASKRIWGDVIVSGRQRWAQTKGFWHDSGERIAPTAWASVRALSEGQTSLNELIDIETYDGQQKTIENSVAPIRNAEGLIVGAVIVNADVTERVRAEEQLRRTNEELRALSARLHSVREEESARIAREIHDEIGAELTSLKWDMEEVGEIISELRDGPRLAALREKVAAMIALTDNAVDTVRRISAELRPTALEEFGLAEALRWHAQQFQARTGIMVNCDCPQEDVDLSREQSTAVFRIFQEALTNVLRHAQAARVDIEMRQEEDRLVLTIRDDGRGITEEEKTGPHSLGLLGMRERTHLLGGEINVEGAQGRGTVVTLRVPTAAKEAAGGRPSG
jgi:PAS domain S-box-containing protein